MWVQNTNSENASHALLPRDCNSLWLFIKAKQCVAESNKDDNPPGSDGESDADERISAIDSDDEEESECGLTRRRAGWERGRVDPSARRSGSCVLF